MTIKKIITAGCSFSAVAAEHEFGTTKDFSGGMSNWPYRLMEKNTDIAFRNLGLIGAGQELIQKRTSKAIMEELKNYKPEELAVIVMWSGTDRKAFFIDNEDYIQEIVKEWQNRQNLINLTQFDNIFPKPHHSKQQIVHNKNGVCEYYSDGGWYYIQYMHPDSKLCDSYIETMTTRLAQVTISLENMIFLQNLCTIKGIKLYQAYYRSHVLDDIVEYKEHLNIKYLYDQLNFDTILSTTGMYEHLNPQHTSPYFHNVTEVFNYTQSVFFENLNVKEYFEEDKFHPNQKGSEKWVAEVLLPKLQEQGIML